jgi:release factor glutamine methyltransferase
MSAPAPADAKTVGSLTGWARTVLRDAGIENAVQESQWLLAQALGLRSHELATEAERPLSSAEWSRARSLIARRAAREPLQYLLGTQEFCGLDFQVTPAVLIPRPETELLVQEVIRLGTLKPASIVVDVGTGSGCVAVTLATILRDVRIVAIDRSPAALAAARANAAKHRVADQIEWLEGDLLAPLSGEPARRVDVIVSNPPYIAEADWAGLQPEVRLFEPRMALVSGPRGTEFHERLLREAQPFLTAGGSLMMEVGQGQASVIRRIAERAGGYGPLRTVEDTAGIERIVIAPRLG